MLNNNNLHFFIPTVIDGNEIIYRDYIDISVAVATPKVRSCDMHMSA